MSLILNPSFVMPPLAIYMFHTVRLFKYVKGQKKPKTSSLQEAKMEPFSLYRQSYYLIQLKQRFPKYICT